MSWFKPRDLLDRSFEIGIILLLTLFDAATTALTWREWRKQQTLRQPGTAASSL